MAHRLRHSFGDFNVQRSRGPFLVLVLRLVAVLVLYSALRVLFWTFNWDLFPNAPFEAFVGGVRFDLSAVAWTHLLWVLLVMIDPRPGRIFGRVQFGVFMSINAVALFFNCTDIGYYAFSHKRSTADFFSILTAGGDTASLAPAFLRDYWYLLLAYVGLLVVLGWSYRRIGRLDNGEPTRLPWRVGWRLLTVAGLLLASRGGTQLVPIQPMDAANYGGAAYAPVVLNTPFTLMMTLGKPMIEERVYMGQAEAERLWPVVHHYTAPKDTTERSRVVAQPNVVVIILESFSAAYSARLSGQEGCMPVLDSLMDQSLTFTRAFANGRRSIDGIPAILAALPEWMDEAFITSTYAQTPFTSIASVLRGKGYATSFYHGGRNGTMGFEGFSKSAGFQRYVGLNEYPDPADNDGSWGIWDKPFLQFFAQEMEKERAPFLSCVFTLSSHHPYHLLPEDEARFAGGTQRIQPSLRYTDDALRQFFAKASSMPWYSNTLFVITADHTADLERDGQPNTEAIDHWVPLLYFMPAAIAPQNNDRVTQHIDILPTILDIIGYRDRFFSIGSSALRPERRPLALVYNTGMYMGIDSTGVAYFDGKEVPAPAPDMTNYRPPDAMKIATMKAAIQQFSGNLLRGKLVAEPRPQ